MGAAPKTVKENGGQANINTTYVGDVAAPGSSDVVKIDGSNKRVTLTDPVTEWGAVDFSAGSIEGNKKLTLSLTESSWTGGVIDGATLSTPGITIGAGSEKKLQGAGLLEVLVGGTATWTGDDLVTGGGAEIKNAGTFTTNFGGKITKLTGETSKFTNSGGFVKNTAGTTTEIQATFDSKDAGSNVTVNGGTLRLTGGGESSKPVSLGNDAKLEIATTDYVFSGGALDATGTGSIDVTSAVATFGSTTGSANLAVSGTGTARVNGSHATSGRLKLSAGKLEATASNGAATVGGFDWTGGDVTTVVVNSGDTTIAGTGPKKLYGSAKLNLSGSTNWSADSIGTGGAAEITNTGTFTTSFDGLIAHNQGGTRATFKNEGNFTKSNATSGTTEIQAAFENTAGGASVTVGAGTLKLSGGGASNKGIGLGAGTTLQIAGNDFAISGGAISGATGKLELAGNTTTFTNATSTAGEVAVTGGTAKFDGAHTGSGKLSLSAGGAVTGSGTASFGSLDWKGGQVDGKVSSAGTAGISGSDSKTIGANGELILSANEARSWTGGNISNQGKLTLNSGTTDIQAPFSNSGALEAANGGLVKLRGGGSSSSAVTVGANSKLEVGAVNFAFTGGKLDSDASGVIDVTSAVASFSGTNGNANLTVSGTGTADFADAHSTTGKLKLSSGTIQGAGTAEVGAFDFTGGTLTGKVRSTGNTILSGGSKSLSAGELTLAGTTDWDGTALNASGAAKIKNEAGQLFKANADGILSNNGTALFTNEGTFEKTAGAGAGTVIGARFESVGVSSEIKASAGNLKLTGGGRSSKAVTIGNGASLEIAGTDFAFEGGTINGGTGKLKLSDKITTFSNATSGDAEVVVDGPNATAKFDGTHTGTGKLQLVQGTLSGAGDATFASVDWNGGTLTGKVKSTGSTLLSGGSKSLSAGELTLGGTTDWDGTALNASGAAKIKNEAGQLFKANADGILSNNGTALFTNEGTFEKTAGAGAGTVIGARFESVGVSSEIKASAGNLKLTGGGRSSKAVTIGNGASLEIAATDFAFEGGAINGGTGKLKLSDKITTFSNATSGDAEVVVDGPNATAKFDGTHTGTGKLKLVQGTLSGAGDATFASVDWNGGTLTGKVKSTGSTLLSGGSKSLSAGELTLAGTTDWDGTALNASGAAKIKNEAGQLFKANADGILSNNGTALFTNEGTFEKTAGAGAGTVIGARFESVGVSSEIKASAGNLKLAGGGRSSKAVTIGNGASLEIAATDFAFEGGAINGSTGKLKLSDKITTFSNATGGDAEVVVDGPNATAKFDGTHTGTGKLQLVQGTLSGAGDATFASVDWNGGTLSGKVKSTGSTLLSGGSKSLSAGELTLGGNTAWDGSQINTSGTAKIKNESGRTFSVTADGLIAATGSARFTNDGILDKAGGTGVTEIHAAFDSTGTVSVGANKGTLRLSGGGKTSGNVGVGSGATLQVTANNYEFENVTHSGGGVIEVAGSNATFRNATGSAKFAVSSGQAIFDASNSTAGELALLAGSVTSTNGGEATVGSLLWSGGSLNAKVKSNGNAVIGGGAKSISGGDLTLAGTTTWDGTTLATSNGAKLKNEATGTFNAADGAITHSAGTRGTFTNAGQFNKNSGTGSTVVDTGFENSGTVTVSNGKLKLAQGAANSASGKFEVGAGAELELNGDVTLPASSELKGNGRARFLGSTLLAETLVTVSQFDFDGGTLAGTHTFGGTVNWNGGDWGAASGSHSSTVARGAVLNLGKATGHEFNRRNLINEGTINWLAGSLRGGNGSVFTNEAVFNDLNGGAKTILAPGGFGGTFTFTNNGLYKKTTGGTTTVEIPFVNNGTMEIAAGSVVFAGTFTNHGSVNMRNGASANFSAPVTFGPTQPLSGTGVIDAPHVTAGGQVSPGTSPGTLTLTGDLTLLSTSELLIELAAPGQGTGYDFLSVGGTANLGGSQLKLTLLNSFGPNILPTDSFVVLTATNGLSGAFSNVANGGRVFMVDGVGSFQVNYGLGNAIANSVVLTNFSPIPEPSTYALMGLGVVVILIHLRRRKA